MRLIFLDSGPLGLLTSPLGSPDGDRCRRWAKELSFAGALLFVPEVADYEVRRKLLHIGATAGLRRLDHVKATLYYSALTTPIMLRAAELWAEARRAGLPTAGPKSLDADCIVAAQALDAVGHGDVATVATDNVGHLARFLDARPWHTIR